MAIITPLKKAEYAQEYIRLRGTMQYPMFLEVSLGVKRSFDDWIEVENFQEYVEICRKYGMHVEPDVIFIDAVSDIPGLDKNKIIGGKNITTTFQVGKKFTKDAKRGTVHVYVARKKEDALYAKKFGWYSVIINNRLTNKPFVDHLRFGFALGFPACCVDFFRKYNNWELYSHPYEAYKNSPIIKGRKRGSYYCNNILMDHSYYLIHHLPCSYRCKSTIEFAKEAEKKISSVAPRFMKKTKEILTKPLLIFGERNFIIFEGEMDGDSISYSDAEYHHNPARIEEKVDFFEQIAAGDRLDMRDGSIEIFKGKKLIHSAKKNETWFMIDFD